MATTADPTTTATPRQRRMQLLLVAVVALAIMGGAWILSEQQGLGEIGDGGVNASLLPNVGEPAPELITLTATGEIVRLSDLQGQPVWLNFWGSWCPPCRAEMPELQAAYENLAPRGVIMLGISMQEDPADAVAYANAAGATFPILIDPNYISSVIDPEQFPEVASMMQSWQINNFPTHVFIDRDGIVRAVVLQEMSTETAIHYGEMILSQPSSANVMP